MLVRLGSVCTKIGSGITPRGGSSVYKTEGVALIRSQNVLDFSFSSNGLVFVSDDIAEKMKSVEVVPGDVLLNITGDSVARSCLAPEDKLPARVNQHVMIIRADKTKLNPMYLLFVLQHRKDWLLSQSEVGATRKALTKSLVESLEIDLPDIEHQNKISSIFQNLQQLIHVNERINDYLSQTGDALFNHWVSGISSLQIGSLTDIANFQNGLAMQKYPHSGAESYPVLKIRELNLGHCDSESDLCSTDIKPEVIIDDEDIVFSWSGSLVLKIWFGGRCGLNQHLFKVTSQDYPKWFYYHWIKHHLRDLIDIAQNKATTMGHINRNHLEEAKVVIPTEADLLKINDTMSSIFTLYCSTSRQSVVLEKLRNVLLNTLLNQDK